MALRLVGKLMLVLVAALSLGRPRPATAQAEPDPTWFYGSVSDGPTGVRIAGARLRIGDVTGVSDERGAFGFWAPSGEQVIELAATLPGGQVERLRQADVWLEPGGGLQRQIRLVTGAYLDTHPRLEDGIGVPMQRAPATPDDPPSVDLLELWWERHRDRPGVPTWEELQRLELPDVLPDSIRVLRRYPNSCSGTSFPISEVDLDTYAAGVVTSEIGVFRALTTGEETQLEGFKTLALAARSFALFFWAQDPDASWHLDDTACNQRYTDGPYPAIIEQAAQETSGQLLVQAGTAGTLDRFEYAASCGRCSTLPEYQEALIPDVTGQEACTSGNWCGHNNCAAHTDNPECPLEGPDVRCLVRGICQWGLAERSARGDSVDDIVGHYQPNLDIRDFDGPRPARLLGFVREDSIETGANIGGARASLDSGDVAITGSNGLFAFNDVLSGTYLLTVTAAGYAGVSETVEVEPGIDNWHSVALSAVDSPDPGLEPSDDLGAADPDPPDAGNDDDVLTSGDVPAPDGGGQVGDTPQPPSQLGRFATVGPDGLDSGCSCAAESTSSPGPTTVVSWLLLLAVWRYSFLRSKV